MVLEKGADPDVMGDGHYGNCIAALLDRPFSSVVLEHDLLCLELLLSAGATPNHRVKNGQQALHKAAVYCYQPEIFEMLLRYGTEVNGTFESKERGFEVKTTPLGVLCDNFIKEEACIVLLKGGANPNCYTPSGKNPLQFACYISGSSELAKELIRRGANVWTRSQFDGTTALHDAATAARSDMIKELIEHEANVAARDKRMRTPLHSACWRTPDKEIQQERVENPWETHRRLHVEEKDSALRHTIELLLVLGKADPKARDIEGVTPLHHAVKACNTSSTDTLIRLAPPDTILEKDFMGKLPLHWAAEASFTAGLHSLLSLYSQAHHMRKTTVSYGARPPVWDLQRYLNATDSSGNTPIHYAAQSGYENFVATLLLEPMLADISMRDYAGYRALDLAKKENQIWRNLCSHLSFGELRTFMAGAKPS